MKTRKRIYVAGPYSGDNILSILANIRQGIWICAYLISYGYAVFCPWLDWQYGIITDLTKEQYQSNSMAFVEVCHAMVLMPGWENSKGTLAEKAWAEELGIPVYESITDLEIKETV